MKTNDLIEILKDYPDMPLEFEAPHGQKVFISIIWNKRGETLSIRFGLGESEISKGGELNCDKQFDPAGWQPDATGL